jgi:hypothetical protein
MAVLGEKLASEKKKTIMWFSVETITIGNHETITIGNHTCMFCKIVFFIEFKPFLTVYIVVNCFFTG